jgi:hypothetical protein
MNTNAQLQAMAWGSLVPMAILAILAIRRLTESKSPNEQRAKRLAVFVGFLLSGIVIALEWYCYLNVDAVIACYLAFPTATVVFAIFLTLVPRAYRAFGGQRAPNPKGADKAQPSIQIEPEIRQHQEALRAQLAALPQFRETVDGTLLSLLTGDQVYWDIYAGEPCLTIEFSNRSRIAACRWETLLRYVSIQTQVGRYLPSPIMDAAPAQAARG